MNPIVKTVSMPMGMVVGALFCRRIMAFDEWCGHLTTPVLIFIMLFFTFCRVDMRQMRLQPLHLRLIGFQLVAGPAAYLLLSRFDPVVAQGAMICILAPIAMAAVVIGGMLGADILTMTTYSLLCNFVVAFVLPVALSVVGSGSCSLAEILGRVVPLLVLPFFAAQMCRVLLPRVSGWVSSHSYLSFYMWLLSLAVIIGRTTVFILDLHGADFTVEISLAVVALAICVVQFVVGRRIGRRYGDAAAGGQSLGQKNTVLAVWIAQSFMDPISSIAPTAYIVWQNIVNSLQIYKKDRETAKK